MNYFVAQYGENVYVVNSPLFCFLAEELHKNEKIERLLFLQQQQLGLTTQDLFSRQLQTSFFFFLKSEFCLPCHQSPHVLREALCVKLDTNHKRIL